MMNELPKAIIYRPDFYLGPRTTSTYYRSEIELDRYVIHEAYDEDEHDTEPRRKYYKSDKILGKLYRAINERKIWYEDGTMLRSWMLC
ncbi:hypothetical protein MAP00_003696 [Monascus purpureus]|nr:hypothetical protein MAP00_003696 [Monascus purpureus]